MSTNSASAALVAKVRGQFGPITIAVNNAGIHLKKPALETTEEEFMQVLTTHVLGPMPSAAPSAPGMIERRGGSICLSPRWRL